MGANSKFTYCGPTLPVPKEYLAYTSWVPYEAKPGTSHRGTKSKESKGHCVSGTVKRPPKKKDKTKPWYNYPACNRMWLWGYIDGGNDQLIARMNKYA